MHMNFGKQCENWAADYAGRQLNWQVMAQNVYSRHGELDIVCKDEEGWVFIEVKGRRSDRFGAGYELVSSAKFRRLKKCIQLWMNQEGWLNWRLELWVIKESAHLGIMELERLELL